MRVTAAAKVGHCRDDGRHDGLILRNSLAGAVMRIGTRQGQPVTCNRGAGPKKQRCEEDRISHERQNSSPLAFTSKISLPQSSDSQFAALQSLQPPQPVFGHRRGNFKIDLVDTIKRLWIQDQICCF